jgi:hypothetical protein
MNIEQLENKIGFQIGFLLYSGMAKEQAVEHLKQIAIDYAEQFKYDFSKNCKCESRIGETWCCNQCGLPTTTQAVP